MLNAIIKEGVLSEDTLMFFFLQKPLMFTQLYLVKLSIYKF